MTDWIYEIPGKTLLNVTKLCNAVVDDVVLQVQKNGILMTAVDASHVAMFAITIGEFDENKKEKLKFGVELSKLVDMITGHTKATKSQTDFVKLEFNNVTKQLKVSTGDTQTGINTLDLTTITDPPRLPNLENCGMVEAKDVCPKKFAAALTKQARFGDLATLVLNENELQLTTNTEHYTVETTLSSRNSERTIGSQFSMSYLKPFANRVKDAAKLTLEVGENTPLLARWQHEGINENVGFEVRYFLAPRVESDY